MLANLEATIKCDDAAWVNTGYKNRTQRRVEPTSDLEPKPAAFWLHFFASKKG
jgi:hypothetical protein